MFIRPCYRNKNGKRHACWVLVESYRSERGPRQRVVASMKPVDWESSRSPRKTHLRTEFVAEKTLSRTGATMP